MITVVDQVRPWLTPSNALAASTQDHDGAHINRNGTGRDQPADDEDVLAAESSDSRRQDSW